GVRPAQGTGAFGWEPSHGRPRANSGRLSPRLPRARNDRAPAEVVRLKLHPALLDLLARQVADVPLAAPTPAHILDDWASALARAPLVADMLAESPGAVGRDALARAMTWHRARQEELSAWTAGEPGVEPALDTEDDAILLRLWQLRMGALAASDGRPLRYRHIVIDE